MLRLLCVKCELHLELPQYHHDCIMFYSSVLIYLLKPSSSEMQRSESKLLSRLSQVTTLQASTYVQYSSEFLACSAHYSQAI